MASPVTPGFVKVYVRKRLDFSNCNFQQKEMFHLATAGLYSVKSRVRSLRTATDGAASPLRSESWKRIKQRRGLKPVRDLWGTQFAAIGRKKKGKQRLKFVGHMLNNLTVRAVSVNKAICGFSQYAARIKARANQRRQLWFGYSPSDQRYITSRAKEIFFRQIRQRIARGRIVTRTVATR